MFVAVRRPPGARLIVCPNSPDLFGLMDATSNETGWAGSVICCANSAAALTLIADGDNSRQESTRHDTKTVERTKGLTATYSYRNASVGGCPSRGGPACSRQ
jgi:hypothetical protein